MQIVIDISEGFIDKMNSVKDDRELSWAQLLTVYRAFHAMLQNGISLPKGHGRLIDATAFVAHTDTGGSDEWDDYACYLVDKEPAIIGSESEEV